jgi:MoxR-like ATPase
MERIRNRAERITTNVEDEINRATPRTQSALLEAMAEGTFPLPEVQKDRFFLSLSLGYPSRDDEKQVTSLQHGTEHPLDAIEAVLGRGGGARGAAAGAHGARGHPRHCARRAPLSRCP